MEEKRNNWLVTGKEFFARNSKEKLTLEAVKQLTRENIFSFELAIFNHAMTLPAGKKLRCKQIMEKVREFGFRHCMLLDRLKKMTEEMNAINSAPVRLDIEREALVKEMVKTIKEGNIVNAILDQMFNEFIIILQESF
jgi:hypothetical protein